MSFTVEIRGSETNNEAGADAIILEALGVLPFFIDESESKTYVGGRYRKFKRQRLAFKIVLNDFLVEPDGVWQDSTDYFELWRLLNRRYVWIHAVSAYSGRINDATYGLIAAGEITLPMEVEVYSFTDLSADFPSGTDRLDNIILASIDRFTF